MTATTRSVHEQLLLWGIVVAVTLIVRPPLPVDEALFSGCLGHVVGKPISGALFKRGAV